MQNHNCGTSVYNLRELNLAATTLINKLYFVKFIVFSLYWHNKDLVVACDVWLGEHERSYWEVFPKNGDMLKKSFWNPVNLVILSSQNLRSYEYVTLTSTGSLYKALDYVLWQ